MINAWHTVLNPPNILTKNYLINIVEIFANDKAEF